MTCIVQSQSTVESRPAPILKVSRTSFWLAVTGLLFVSLNAAIGQVTYRVQDLGTLNGEVFSCAMGLSNHGWTEIMDILQVGQNFTLHASVQEHGHSIALGTLGGPNSWINWGGINERGEAVGMSETSEPDPNKEDFCFLGTGTGLKCQPFFWRSGQMTSLPTLGGPNGQASAINNRGQVVGNAETATEETSCPFHIGPPVLWENGLPVALPTVHGDPDGIALGINDQGQIVGTSGPCQGSNHAIQWENGAATELPNLGSLNFNMVFAINNQGQAVGVSSDNTTFYAALWQDGRITKLGFIVGDSAGFATGINEKGQVVGTSLDASGNPSHAFIWENGVMIDLSTLFPPGFYLFPTMANKINASGQISGMATDLNDGTIHAFLATPIHSIPSGAVTNERRAGRAPRAPLPDNVRDQILRRLHLGTWSTE